MIRFGGLLATSPAQNRPRRRDPNTSPDHSIGRSDGRREIEGAARAPHDRDRDPAHFRVIPQKWEACLRYPCTKRSDLPSIPSGSTTAHAPVGPATFPKPHRMPTPPLQDSPRPRQGHAPVGYIRIPWYKIVGCPAARAGGSDACE
ncbi:hypothetical protein K1719_047535 [Acacia pycnantha]|nr:hypothetical protein K1719_047535 [Acacia pycnantha]